jgi:hypothetical protein
MDSKLYFSLSDCKTSFTAFDVYKRCEVSFIAKPKFFTITTFEDFLITSNTDYSECGDKIQVGIVADDFADTAHGFITPSAGSFIHIALSFNEQQMTYLNSFIVNKSYPTELEIVIEGVNLQNRNIKMADEQYKISSWNFTI